MEKSESEKRAVTVHCGELPWARQLGTGGHDTNWCTWMTHEAMRQGLRKAISCKGKCLSVLFTGWEKVLSLKFLLGIAYEFLHFRGNFMTVGPLVRQLAAECLGASCDILGKQTVGGNDLVWALWLGQWALGWKITQVRTMELNVKDPISSPCLFVLCLSYIIIPSSSLHYDDNLQCLHLRIYWKEQMMVQTNVFPTEGPQNAHGPISEEITCSTASLKNVLHMQHWTATS